MTWAQRLKRVFSIDIEKCEKCGGPVRIIASIEDPEYQAIAKHRRAGTDTQFLTMVHGLPAR